MPKPTKEEVIDFIKKNESFFKKPLPDFVPLRDNSSLFIPVESKSQEEFSNFFERNNKIEYIKDYSSKLERLLYSEREKTSENTQKPLTNYWNRGDFETVLKNEKIRNFIMENKDHPAILLWKNSKKFEQFDICLQRIKEKGEELSRRGYPRTAKIIDDLYTNLIAQKENLIEEKSSTQDFHKNCNQLIEEAQDSELKNHRGFLGTIWHSIKIALNAITFGVVSAPTTKSIQKTTELKDSLKKIIDSNAIKVEDESQQKENNDFMLK